MRQNQNTQSAWHYHDETKHSYWSIRTSPHHLDWINKPSPFKIYPDIEPIALPRTFTPTGMPALDAIASPGIEPSGEQIPGLDKIASLLFYSAGVMREKTYPGGKIYFRAAACAGALYPTEIYLVCSDIEGLRAGVYHFNPGDFALRRLREGDFRGHLFHATGANARLASSPVALIHSAISWRSTWKYRDRAYRYHFWDNGTMLANELAMAVAHGLPAEVVLGFVESDVNRLIGIDGETELALSLLAIGHTENALTASGASQQLADLEFKSLPLSDREVDYPSIREMHRASSLTAMSEVSDWRSAKTESKAGQKGAELISIRTRPPEQLPVVSIEEVIERRASTRRFARKAVSLDNLFTILDRSRRGIPTDLGRDPDDQLNDIYLIVNFVDDLAQGAYFYRREEQALELLKEGDFSERAAYLTLEQDLGGDASVTLFFMADVSGLLQAYGNRGYRAVQMEAGITGGKVYLASYALNRGATGLTFYDDEVTGFFSPHAAGKSCIFVTAVGVPGKRPMF